ncbi:MAG: DUF2029 domain-containing protein [Chloroflexi bacterium]|nr:DUF2029 domain-containing protein [Chloroflexota bacterium]
MRARAADAVFLLVVLAGGAIRVWGASIGGDVADVSAYRHHIFIVESGRGIYQTEARFPYFPGWLGVELGVWHVSQILDMQFWWLIRIVIVLADVANCFAIRWVAASTQGTDRARIAGMVYALAPIAIIISGHHGQFDALPGLLALVAVGLVVRGKRPVVAGLLLGGALALKPFPALLIPVILRAPEMSVRARLAVCAVAGSVVLAVSAPFLLVDALAMYSNIAGYGGLNDQGFGGILRSLWLIRADNVYLPGAFGQEISTTTRWLTLALMAAALSWLWRASTTRVAAAMFMIFVVSFGAVSTQYLIWPLPWLLVANVSLALPILYAIGAALGAIGFYLVYWPAMILPATQIRPPALQFVPTFVATQVVAWLVMISMCVGTLRPPAMTRVSRWLFYLCLVAIALAARPIVDQMNWYITEWIKFRQ